MIDKLAHDIARAAEVKLAALEPRHADILKTMGVGGLLGSASGILGHYIGSADPDNRWYTPAITRGIVGGASGAMIGKYLAPKSNILSGALALLGGLGHGLTSPTKKEWNLMLDEGSTDAENYGLSPEEIAKIKEINESMKF